MIWRSRSEFHYFDKKFSEDVMVWFIPLRMNARCAGKTVRSLENACHILVPERDVFTTRRYTNPRLPLPYLTLPVRYRVVMRP